MKKTGTLTIDDDRVSRLKGTRLIKGAVNNGGFGRATNFLEQDRSLRDGDRIWVEGNDNFLGAMPVIVITDAGAQLSTATSLNATKAAGASKAAKKSTAKKSGAKKSGGGKGKAAAKKSTGKVSGK